MIEITKKNCVPNQYKVKYHHLLSGFVTTNILGHIFDGVSPATVILADMGVCPDILEISPESLILTYGPNDAAVEEEVLEEMNAVGGICVKLILPKLEMVLLSFL